MYSSELEQRAQSVSNMLSTARKKKKKQALRTENGKWALRSDTWMDGMDGQRTWSGVPVHYLAKVTRIVLVGSSQLYTKGKKQIPQPLKMFFFPFFWCLYPQGPSKAAVLCLTVFFK